MGAHYYVMEFSVIVGTMWLVIACAFHFIIITATAFCIHKPFTCSEDGGDMFLRNVGQNEEYTAPKPRRRLSS
jgi:hypothetical protein